MCLYVVSLCWIKSLSMFLWKVYAHIGLTGLHLDTSLCILMTRCIKHKKKILSFFITLSNLNSKVKPLPNLGVAIMAKIIHLLLLWRFIKTLTWYLLEKSISQESNILSIFVCFFKLMIFLVWYWYIHRDVFLLSKDYKIWQKILNASI